MKTELPFQIRIAKPCPARWEDMGGDDRIRFCDHCRKNVYNLAGLPGAEAAAFLREKQGNLCARIYQRADGTLLTEDCPVGIARQWRRFRTLVAGGVGAILLTAATATALGRDGSGRPNRVSKALQEAALKVKSWLGLKPSPPPLLGMVVPITTPPKSSAPSTPAKMPVQVGK